MLGITEWRDYITRLADASENIRHSMLVVDVAHLKERLKELDYSLNFPLLVGVIPTAYASTTLDEDNISELNVCMLFVLSPLTTDGSDAEIESYVTTHNAIVDIKRTMREDYFNCEAYPLLRDIKFKSYVQDPEWNVLGLMGWSLGFEIETGEYASGEPLPPVPPQPPIPPTYSELTYEYTADGLVLILSVKNNYEESGTFIVYFKTDEEDYVMLNAWVNSKETYVFRTLARQTNNLVAHTARAFNYQTIQIRQITIPATPFFSYSNFTAVYADDAEYNDIIRCSLTATNNSLIDQNCTIYFKLGDYLVQQSYLIPALSSHVFTYDFENVDIYVENTVTFHNSVMQVIGSVTIDATIRTPLEMFFTSGTFTIRLGRVERPFSIFLTLENGSVREVEINIVSYEPNYTTVTQIYSNSFEKRIWIDDVDAVDNFYVYNQYNLRIDNQVWKLRNVQFLHLWDVKLNLILHEIRKLKRLLYINITRYLVPSINFSCYIDSSDIINKINLGYLQFFQCTNLFIDANTIEKLINLTYLRIYYPGYCRITELEIGKLTKLISLYLTYFTAKKAECEIATQSIEKLTKLETLNLYNINANIAENEITALSNFRSSGYLDIQNIQNIQISNTEIFRTSYISLNNSSMTSASVDNVFIRYAALIQAGSLIPTVTKTINVAGTSNAKVTAASLTARTYLLSIGYTLTFNS